MRPLASLKKGQPIAFDIAPSSELYIDPRIYMKVTFKITNDDGTSIGGDIPVAPMNNYLHSLWRHVECQINTRNVTITSGNYTYVSYFLNQFVRDKTEKETTMETDNFYEDTPGEFDAVDPASNLGFKERQILANDSSLITGFGPVAIDLFQRKKLIPPGFGLSLKFYPNGDTVFIMSGTAQPDEVFNIADMSVFYKTIKLSSGLRTAISSGMLHKPIVYPIKRHAVSVYEEPAGTTLVHRNVSSFTTLPETVFIGIVSADAINGNYLKNPFNFITKSCSNASIFIVGKRIPTNDYSPNYDAKDAHQAYQSLVKYSRLQGVTTNGVSYREYMMDGNGVWIFNISETQQGSVSAVKEGCLSFELELPYRKS